MLRAAVAAESGERTPISGWGRDCCARAASGHAAPAPQSSLMNSRRRKLNIGLPSLELSRGSVYRTLSLLRRARQVVGSALNCSEIGGLMSALGQKQTSAGHLAYVRFTPESGHQPTDLSTSALCH